MTDDSALRRHIRGNADFVGVTAPQPPEGDLSFENLLFLTGIPDDLAEWVN